jgi:phosphoribosyl-ATP pyrophosphohydrolase/phosphoribosyl-AMP cyclohydrolase
VSAISRDAVCPPRDTHVPHELDSVRWNEDGLVPAIVQDAVRGDVLMLAWMNRESLALTLSEGRTVFWSRSRGELWRKGETSGNVQRVRDVRLDCDGDTLLVTVDQAGGTACHTGRRSCFFQALDGEEAGGTAGTEADGILAAGALESLARRLEERKSADPATSWTARLHAEGLDAILKKVGEEATETVLAAKGGDRSRVVEETADLWFHTMVMLANLGLGPEDVLEELDRRAGRSGLAEKAARTGPG